MSQRLFSLISIASNRLPSATIQQISNRSLFAYLRIAFNKVDQARLAEVGPDRLCAEWFVEHEVNFHFFAAK